MKTVLGRIPEERIVVGHRADGSDVEMIFEAEPVVVRPLPAGPFGEVIDTITTAFQNRFGKIRCRSRVRR